MANNNNGGVQQVSDLRVPPGYKITSNTRQCQFPECSHIWEKRADTEPVVCPRCKRYGWREGKPAAKSVKTKEVEDATASSGLTGQRKHDPLKDARRKLKQIQQN